MTRIELEPIRAVATENNDETVLTLLAEIERLLVVQEQHDAVVNAHEQLQQIYQEVVVEARKMRDEVSLLTAWKEENTGSRDALQAEITRLQNRFSQAAADSDRGWQDYKSKEAARMLAHKEGAFQRGVIAVKRVVSQLIESDEELSKLYPAILLSQRVTSLPDIEYTEETA